MIANQTPSVYTALCNRQAVKALISTAKEEFCSVHRVVSCLLACLCPAVSAAVVKWDYKTYMASLAAAARR
jgi:hypothetical protein